MTPPRTAWLAFALLGILDTVLLLEFPIAGLLLLVLALAGVMWRPPRLAAFAGLLTGNWWHLDWPHAARQGLV